MKPNKMSLNPIPSIINYVDLVDKFKRQRKRIKQKFGVKIKFADWIGRRGINIDHEVQKPVDMAQYYQRVKRNGTGKYMNFR